MKSFLLASIFWVIFLAAAGQGVWDNSFHNDDVEMIQKGAAIYERPASILERDRDGRNHMFLFVLMGAIHQKFGLNPRIFHLTLLVFHSLVFFLVAVFGRRLGLTPLGAAVAAVFFLVLSLHFQIVGWIAEMGRILMNAFNLAALIFFDAFRKTGKGIFLVLCASVWYLAFHCSEEAVVLLFIFAAYDSVILKKNLFLKENRPLLRSYVPLAGVALLMLAFPLFYYKHVSTVYYHTDFQGFQKLKSLAWTLANLGVPRREALAGWTHPSALNRLAVPSAIFGPLFLWIVLRFRFLIREKQMAALTLFSILWFFIAFLPFALLSRIHADGPRLGRQFQRVVECAARTAVVFEQIIQHRLFGVARAGENIE